MKKSTALTAILLSLCVTSSFANISLPAEQAALLNGQDFEYIGTISDTTFENDVVHIGVEPGSKFPRSKSLIPHAYVTFNGKDLPAGLALLAATGKKIVLVGGAINSSNLQYIQIVSDDYDKGENSKFKK
jgi:hypothetical protein